MNILLSFRQGIHNEMPVECYPRSFARVLRELGHTVMCVGEGHQPENFGNWYDEKGYDLFIEIDNGRNKNGELALLQPNYKLKIPSAVWLIDSHGYPDLHKEISKDYSHVFYAVWNKRDLFKDHPSAHWCPNATDSKWFNNVDYIREPIEFDYGFFSSKDGLNRAMFLKQILERLGYTYDIRQVSKSHRHKWPYYSQAMSRCIYLYNWGQKNDGPNQRVMESMAMGKPLLTDNDVKSGMSKLFEDGKHYVGFERDFTNLEEKILWMLNNPEKCMEIAKAGHEEVMKNHLINNRVKQILEVF